MANDGDIKAILFLNDADSIKKMELIFSELSIETERVKDGIESFDSIVEFSPDLIVADIDFREIGGFDILDGLHGRNITAPIVLCGEDSSGNILRALRSGARDYIVKPFSESMLRDRLSAVVSSIVGRSDAYDESARELLVQMERNNRELNTLLEVTSIYHVSGDSKKEILYRLTDLAAKSMNCEAASIMLINERANALEFVVATGEKKNRLETLTVPMGEGIAGWVAVNGQAQIVNDTSSDPRFTGKVDEESGFTTRQILAVPLMLDKVIIGVLEVINSNDGRVLDDSDVSALTTFSEKAAEVIDAARTNEDQQNFFVQMTNIIVKAIEKKDMFSVGHPWNVAELSHKIALDLGMNETDKSDLHYAALLHDIGKLEMPCILFNKRTLSDRELDFIRQHPVKGAKLLEPISLWNGVVPLVLYHHEAWDGSGYPFGKSGEGIPLGARILNIAESFTVMRSPNSYKRRMSIKEAILEIMRLSGKQFDPNLVKVFVSVLEKDISLH